MGKMYRTQWSDREAGSPFGPNFTFNWSWLKWLIPAVVVLWFLSGIYIVRPDEQGVVRMFGKAVRVTQPGPHYHLPRPIERVDKVKVKQVRRIEIGFRTVNPGPPARYRFVPQESLMLTGDEQIVDAQIIVQYQVKDPTKFLFNVRDLERPQGALMDAAEVALRQVVGQRPIDDVLIGEKLQIEIDIRELLQQIIDGYNSGVRVVEVKLQTVRPPEEVASAFSDVVSAKEDKERLIKEADGYRED
ncbi:MAG: FtsH protease activity modulator HflK, partial [Planctomycetota bacterium]